MLLTSIDPFVQEFERQFDRLARQAAQGSGAVMPMDGIRRADDVVLRFDLPGIDPDSIEVTVDRGVLSVTARREEEFGEDERVFVRERVMGAFTRRVYLSEHLDAEAIEAAYNNGVLAVRIPVLERAKPRKVAVQQSGDTYKAIKS
ncbi:Hsp20/alpha crystallin family protein [Nonomuraea roseoviolacea subsp. roseoviolacea]|uniref:HSP20 family protein n=1 Tax=Nonomuraea roseoviolacea subsp. carminata TaxID=160689 RepID=A0ABT1KH66_9ACTN|nr:Hsp20/alpha crystallin family protein [Nonomuraea roseoviolacea]MCP2352927.1 HSP20 family protein [Nonomuraea roseoviolacea subsp. carminata]